MMLTHLLAYVAVTVLLSAAVVIGMCLDTPVPERAGSEAN